MHSGTQLLGRPECDVLLAHCATHLARARKSHAVYGALGRAYAALDSLAPVRAACPLFRCTSVPPPVVQDTDLFQD